MSKLSTALGNLATGEISCSYVTLRACLDREDGMSLDEAIQKGIPSYVLVKILRAEGYKIGHGSVQDHRDGTCKCTKGEK